MLNSDRDLRGGHSAAAHFRTSRPCSLCGNLANASQGYDLAIYRAGNDEPLHVLGRTDEEDCTALTLSYRAIPLWEDQGTWHLLVLNADQEPVYRFEESVTLLSTSLDPVPELLSGTFEEGVLSVSLEIDTLSHTEVEVLAIAPSGQRTVLRNTRRPNAFKARTSKRLRQVRGSCA